MPGSVPKHTVRREIGVRDAPNARRAEIHLHVKGVDVPAILQLPATRPAPAALLLHGYSSRKERLADTVGRAFFARGIASLAIDLPLHGERENDVEADSMRNPIKLIGHWTLALEECSAALRFLESHPDIDRERLAITGYSMGSFLAITAAAADPVVRAVVLAAGGDLPPDTPFASLIRTVADPPRAARALAGRPMLMVHGKRDRTVTPAQAERLFAAAHEPKTLLWYDAGHWLPNNAIEDAAEWLANILGAQDLDVRR